MANHAVPSRLFFFYFYPPTSSRTSLWLAQPVRRAILPYSKEAVGRLLLRSMVRYSALYIIRICTKSLVGRMIFNTLHSHRPFLSPSRGSFLGRRGVSKEWEAGIRRQVGYEKKGGFQGQRRAS